MVPPESADRRRGSPPEGDGRGDGETEVDATVSQNRRFELEAVEETEDRNPPPCLSLEEAAPPMRLREGSLEGRCGIFSRIPCEDALWGSEVPSKSAVSLSSLSLSSLFFCIFICDFCLLTVSF
mmetsp:Transcript_45524/g.89670  ORF Transcript_45524/g.89670 Transcript_45524/m.89670 type:complete len:124 (-) Transcript_45524:518-889(-)